MNFVHPNWLWLLSATPCVWWIVGNCVMIEKFLSTGFSRFFLSPILNWGLTDRCASRETETHRQSQTDWNDWQRNARWAFVVLPLAFLTSAAQCCCSGRSSNYSITCRNCAQLNMVACMKFEGWNLDTQMYVTVIRIRTNIALHTSVMICETARY